MVFWITSVHLDLSNSRFLGGCKDKKISRPLANKFLSLIVSWKIGFLFA